MKRTGLTVCVLLALSATVKEVADVWAGTVLDRIQQRGYFRMVEVSDWPPFSARNASGQLEGFDFDVAEEIARRMGVAVQRVPDITWEMETGGHWNDVIDISIGSMTPTAKRDENLDFPAVYYYTIAALAVHKNNTNIKTPADAGGKRIGALRAATYDLYLRRVPFDIVGMPPVVYKIDNPVIVNYDAEGDAFEALARGDGVELDGLVNYVPVLMALIKEGKPFRIIGQPLYLAPQSVAIEPGDPEFAALLKEIVDDMHADGTLTNLSMKWFDYDLTRRR